MTDTPREQSNPQDDADRGEFSNYARTGWHWSDTLWLAALLVGEWAIVALIAHLLLGR